MSDSPAPVTQNTAFWRQGLALASGVLAADQISKWAALDHFNQAPSQIEVTSFFNLVLVWNRGVSFGMFGGAGSWGPWALVGLAVVISIFLSVWMVRADTRTTALGLALIIGGAVGNVIDRVRFGAVVDFLDFHAMGYHWPAFNVADSAITIGAAVLILESLFNKPETP